MKRIMPLVLAFFMLLTLVPSVALAKQEAYFPKFKTEDVGLTTPTEKDATRFDKTVATVDKITSGASYSSKTIKSLDSTIKNIKTEWLKQRAQYHKALALQKYGRHSDSLKLLVKLTKEFRKLKDWEYLCSTYVLMGDIYATNTGDVTKSADSFILAFGLETESGLQLAPAQKKSIAAKITDLTPLLKTTKTSLDPITLVIKETATISTGYDSTNIKVKTAYSTSNKSVAKVSSSGIITAVKQGKATITIKCGNQTTTAVVNVVKTAPKTTPPSSSKSNTDDYSAYIAEVVRLTNIEREKAGASPLVLDEKLNQAAAIRAQEQASSVGHTRPDGSAWHTILKEIGVPASQNHWGENATMGRATPEDAVLAWRQSPGHYANMIKKKYKKIGVGVSYNEFYQMYDWVQLFAN